MNDKDVLYRIYYIVTLASTDALCSPSSSFWAIHELATKILTVWHPLKILKSKLEGLGQRGDRAGDGNKSLMIHNTGAGRKIFQKNVNLG